MSHIFYDHLISLEEIDKEIKSQTTSREEREELWNLVDEIVHHRVMGCILGSLHVDHHDHFLERFQAAPHDRSLMSFLKKKVGENIEEIIRQEMGDLVVEILDEIKPPKKNKKK